MFSIEAHEVFDVHSSRFIVFSIEAYEVFDVFSRRVIVFSIVFIPEFAPNVSCCAV